MDREQLYESFDNGVIGLDDIIDISQKNGYNQALEDVRNLTFRDVTYTDSLNDRTELRELIDELTK